MVMEVRVVPKIAINDECPWTPQLSVHSVDVTKAFWSTKSVICLSISLIVVVLIGVLIGALLVSVNGETGKSNSIILARKCKLNWDFPILEKTKHKCSLEDRIGDGICQRKNNNFRCDYDGGDCCNVKSNKRSSELLKCENCSCHLFKSTTMKFLLTTTKPFIPPGLDPDFIPPGLQ